MMNIEHSTAVMKGWSAPKIWRQGLGLEVGYER